jgi:hypothetical protein
VSEGRGAKEEKLPLITGGYRLDALARATGETRSGYTARMALQGHQATT